MDRNELRRLQKAARDNNKFALSEWATQFENQVKQELQRQYDKFYEEQLTESIDTFCIAIAYTARFSETTHLSKNKLPEFMSDLFETVDMFRKGEYSPLEYKEELDKCGVKFDDYQYSRVDKTKKKKELEEQDNKSTEC